MSGLYQWHSRQQSADFPMIVCFVFEKTTKSVIKQPLIERDYFTSARKK